MTRRLLLVAGWLVVAQIGLGAIYWALLSTPESNAWMLALSTLLVAALVLAGGIALDIGVRLWNGRRARPATLGDWLRPGLRLVPALAVFALCAWLAGTLDAATEASRGRVTAWLIARFGWANPEILFTTAHWLATSLAWVIGPLLAAAVFGALSRGVAATPPGRWLRQALAPRALGIGVIVLVALTTIWPRVEAWRPPLPPTWIQLVVVGAKIGVALLLVALATATYLRLAALDPDRAS